jgi:hypothetical protein
MENISDQVIINILSTSKGMLKKCREIKGCNFLPPNLFLFAELQ